MTGLADAHAFVQFTWITPSLHPPSLSDNSASTMQAGAFHTWITMITILLRTCDPGGTYDADTPHPTSSVRFPFYIPWAVRHDRHHPDAPVAMMIGDDRVPFRVASHPLHQIRAAVRPMGRPRSSGRVCAFSASEADLDTSMRGCLVRNRTGRGGSGSRSLHRYRSTATSDRMIDKGKKKANCPGEQTSK